MSEIYVKSTGLVNSLNRAEVDIRFPVRYMREAVLIHRIRALISQTYAQNGAIIWLFGFTRNPDNYPVAVLDFFEDEATWGVIMHSRNSYGAAGGYSVLCEDREHEIEVDALVPAALRGVFFNELPEGNARRFRLEIYYDVVPVSRQEAQTLYLKHNKRG